MSDELRLAAALSAYDAGCSVIPIAGDGTKKTSLTQWNPYRQKRATREQVAAWMESHTGYAIVCGPASGNLEVLDFETREIFDAFVQAAAAVGRGELVARMRRGYEARTPDGGAHLPYTCTLVEGSTKLAQRFIDDPERPGKQKRDTLIETRGDGAYFIGQGSNGRVHPSGRPWVLVSGGFGTIPNITPEERAQLLALARTFDEIPIERTDDAPVAPRASGEGKRPGEAFRERHGTLETFLPIIELHGWRLKHRRGNVGYLIRPGKEDGWSATFGHDGGDYFYPFTTSTEFESERGYNPFSVYAILNHAGDFTAAARELSKQGYGDKPGVIVPSAPNAAGDSSQAAELQINAQNQNIPELAKEAWAAIRGANDPARLFLFGDVPTRIDCGEDGAPLPQTLTEDRLLHELARSAVWYRHAKDPETGNKQRMHAKPPRDIARDMLAAPSFPLPSLTRIIQAPAFAPDGSLAMRAGYHAASRTYYAPNGLRVPSVPDKPTQAQIGAARELLADELLGDFPFADVSEQAHAIALLLLPFMRDLIDGPTPLHLIEKPSAGTGAGLLADAIIRVATGRSPSIMTEGRDEDEWRKRITAILRGAPEAVMIDNLRRPLDSAALSAAITGTVWSDRILGLSETVRLPIRCSWIATGNNPGVSSEIARRIVRIRLDARQDRPWLRSEFRHPDLIAWLMSHRGEIVAACLTLGRAWFAEGCPTIPSAIRLGSFEAWSRVMGGVLHVAGVPGFLSNLREFYDSADVEGNTIRAFLERWWDQHQSRPVAVPDLFDIATETGIELGRGSDRSQRTTLGTKIRKLRDQHYSFESGLTVRVEEAGKDSRTKGQLWRLVTPKPAEPTELTEPLVQRAKEYQSLNAYTEGGKVPQRSVGSATSAFADSEEPEDLV